MHLKTVCVLGGTGFVGHHLAQRLVELGYRVRVLARRRERHRDLLVLPMLDLIEADIFNLRVLAEQFTGCDAVINLVGILNEPGHKGHGFRAAHVELPGKIVRACLASGVERVLHMSALNANTRNAPSHYLRSKGEGEDLLHAVPDLRVTSFRPSVIFGPGDSFINRFAGLLRRIPLIFPLACPHARFAPVYVEDVVEAFIRALPDFHTIGRRYDLCGPRAYTLEQLVEYTALTIGVRRRIVGLSDRLSRLQASIFEYLPGKPFSRDNYLSLQVDSLCSESFPAIFNIKPTPLESIVPNYLAPGGVKTRYSGYRTHANRE
mgnify:CR=1 FL=1